MFPAPQVTPSIDGETQKGAIKPGGQCNFFLKKKKRFCKFQPVEGKHVCAQHLCPTESGELILNKKKRIPCPLDSKHTVFEGRLESHLKKCNARPDSRAYEVKDLHLGEEEEPAQCQLSELPMEKLTELVTKISKLCQDSVKVVSDVREHPHLRDIVHNPAHKKCLKHRVQEASLLGHMASHGWLEDGKVYLEFGAGRAKLSSHILHLCSYHSNSRLVLIDRYHTRGKCENKYKHKPNSPAVERLKIDIKDLDLEKYLTESEDSIRNKGIVSYSKHLCGSATDLTLSCLQPVMSSHHHNEDNSKQLRLEKRLHGVLIALCCHHCCTWRSYVGKQFWIENGLTSVDFSIIRLLSSWATCAFPRAAKEEQQDETEEDPGEHDAVLGPQESRYDIWTIDEKEKIGYECKRIIDAGRAAFLKTYGYKTEFLEYVTRNYSLENVILVATPYSEATAHS